LLKQFLIVDDSGRKFNDPVKLNAGRIAARKKATQFTW
jgi:hypothetical protein